MAVTINGSGPITGLTTIASPTTINGLTIPTTTFGKILQVVMGTTSTAVTVTTTTYVDTNLTATITPSSASNKVLVMVSHGLSVDETGNVYMAAGAFRLVRDGSVIQTGPGGVMIRGQRTADGNNNFDASGQVSILRLDSPASTSALVYKTQMAAGISTAYTSAEPQTIVLMEVAA